MPRALALLALLLALGLGAEGFSPCARVVGGRSSSRGCRRPRRRHGGAPSRLFSSASPASSVPPSPQPQAQAQLGEGEEEEEEEEAGAEEQVPVPPPRRRMVMTMAGVEKRRRKLEEEAREEELREEEQKKMEKQNRKNKRKASSSSAALVKKKTLAELTVADDEEPRWYLLQVRTGMEKVCETIINRKIEDWGMRDRIERVIVPTRKAPKTRGKSVKVQDVPLYVGYVYFHCRMCQELRDLVGRLPHVAGFTGMHRDENNIRIPDPMPEEQMKIVFDRMEEGESIPDIMASELGIRDAVEIVKGPYKGLTGLLRVVRPDELVVRIFENNQETDVTLEHDGVRKLSTGELEALEAEKERQARTSASLESIANARGVSVRGDRGRDGSYGRFENDLDREKGRFMPKYQRMARAQNAPTSSKKSDRRIGANDWDQQNRRRNEGSSFEPAVVNSDLDSDGNDAWAFLDDIVSSSPTQSESSERVQGDSSGSRDDMAELADILGSTAGEGEQGGWEESLAPKKGSSSQIEPPKSGGDDAFFASLMKELNAEYGISDEAEKGGEDGAAPAADLDDLLAEFSGDEYKPAGAQGGQTNIVEEVGGSSFEDLLSSFEEGGGAEALGVNFSLGGDADEGDANFNFSEEPDSAPVSSKSAGGRREKGAMSSPGDDLDDLLAAFEGGDMDDLDVGLDLSLDKAAVENNAEVSESADSRQSVWPIPE
jgi:transcriptional antiterminator NusG